MPKQKSSPLQSPLFKRSVPQMSEGYYSSGPNPNLHRFVEEHATSYSPEMDDYNVPPFNKEITVENRRDPINDLHIYWSKKPYTAIQQYIRHFTKPGDLVLDSFSGSGGTALATLMEGRSSIAIDLSPAATFITKNYCTPVDADELQRAFENLKAKVKPEMDWLYESRCDRCNGKAIIKGTIYAYIYQCGRCLEKIPFSDTIPVQIDSNGIKKEINACPNCFSMGVMEEIDVEKCKKFPYVPVRVSYMCIEGCKPERNERDYKDKDPNKNTYFRKYDLEKIQELDKRSIPYWYPVDRMLNTSEKQKIWGLLWRPYHGDISRVYQFFTKRNLWALAIILENIKKISNFKIREALTFAFSGALYNATIMYRQREAGGGPQIGNYYVPPVFREVMVWTLFEQKVQNLLKAQDLLVYPNEQADICISTQSATDLKDIRDNSIDYIFTDPPYSYKVQYGELNFLWETWLQFNPLWLDKEIIINKVRKIGVEAWVEGMSRAMNECYRVLKPGRWLSLCYHDSSEGTWQLVQDLMAENGFIPESAENTGFIETGQKSYHQLKDNQVTKRDLIINFRKPRLGEVAARVILTGDEDATSFFEKGRAILIEALEVHPGSTADRLYDELVSRMVRRGEFQRHNFDELLRSVAEPVAEPVMKNLFEQKEADLFGSHEAVRWYLLDTAGQLDEAEGKKENAVSQRLEAFMQRWLREHPGESGVHYSDLFEQYLPISDKPRRLLQEWLPEFFFKTAEGTWRPAKDEEERQQKLGLRSTGVLRHIKRFANALSEGVPPGERDKPANAATLADWIYQCRRAGLYDLGRILYEKGGLRFDGLGEELQLQVEEDYQICVRRSERKENGMKRKQRVVQEKLLE